MKLDALCICNKASDEGAKCDEIAARAEGGINKLPLMIAVQHVDLISHATLSVSSSVVHSVWGERKIEKYIREGREKRERE